MAYDIILHSTGSGAFDIVLSGEPGAAPDVYGSIRLTQATTDYLTRTSNVLDFNSSYTLMFWAKLITAHEWTGGVGVYNITDTASDYNQDTVEFSNSNGLRPIASSYKSGAGGAVDLGSDISTGVWKHYAIVRSGSASLKFYVDGTYIGEQTTSISGRGSAENMIVGGWNNPDGTGVSGFLDVELCSLKAWTTNLNATQVVTESQYRNNVFSSSVHAVWPLDGENVSTILHDTSSNAYHLSIVNGTATAGASAPEGLLWYTPAAATASISATMSGGALAGGTSTFADGRVYIATAGGVAGGSATIAFTKTTSISAAGGALAGGSATIAFTKTTSINGAGGAIAGYSASVASGRVVTSSAGAVAGSAATVAFTKTMAVSATAGGVVGGSATIAFNRDYTYPYFFLDYFDRANETPLASPWGSLSTFNQFNLSSNQATAGAGNSVSVYNNLSGSSYYVSWNYLNNPSYGGVVILASGSNGYAIAPEIPYPGTHYSMNVYRINGTTLSSIGSWSSVYPTGGTLPGCFLQVRSEVGSNNVLLTLWVGGTRIGNVTVSEFTVGAGKVGLFSNASTALDIFEVGGLYAGGLAGGSADVTFTKTVSVNGTGGAIAGGAATIQTTGLQTYTVSGVGGAVAGYSSSLAVGRVEVGVAGAVGGGSSLVELTKTYSYSAVGGAIAGYAAALATGRVEVGVAGGIAGGAAEVQVGSTQTYEMSATGGAIAGYQATLELGRAYSGIGGSVAGGTADKAVSRNLDVTMASGAVAGFAALYTFGRSEVTTAGAVAGGDSTHAFGRVEDIDGGAVTGGTSDVSFLSIFGASSTKGIGVELQRGFGVHVEERILGSKIERHLGTWTAKRILGAKPIRQFGAYES